MGTCPDLDCIECELRLSPLGARVVVAKMWEEENGE